MRPPTRIWRGGILVLLAVACVGPNPSYRTGSTGGASGADEARADGPGLGSDGAGGGADGGTGGGGGAGGSSSGGGAPGADDAAGNDAGPVDTDSPPTPDAVAIDGGDTGAEPSAAGLVLHWRFDDPPSSLAADDSSVNELNGAYEGNADTYSAQHAPTAFANVASRRFTSADQAVVLDSAFARLRPTTGITVSVWFRTSVRTRTDLVSFNLDYFIRFMPPALEFVRRRPVNASGTQNFITATAEMVSANDDRWHHVAGSSKPDETTLWLDGVRVAVDRAQSPFLYTAGVNRVMVGRAVDGSRTFTGWLDDFRIYDRVLTDDEIRTLARRAP